jgi:hypothetical protein
MLDPNEHNDGQRYEIRTRDAKTINGTTTPLPRRKHETNESI